MSALVASSCCASSSSEKRAGSWSRAAGASTAALHVNGSEYELSVIALSYSLKHVNKVE